MDDTIGFIGQLSSGQAYVDCQQRQGCSQYVISAAFKHLAGVRTVLMLSFLRAVRRKLILCSAVLPFVRVFVNQ